MLVSDIPDWVYSETGYAFQEGPLSTEFISSLQRASPISLVDKIKTPVLFTIGENDKRVPPLQGLNFFYALKQNAVDSEWVLLCRPGFRLFSTSTLGFSCTLTGMLLILSRRNMTVL